MTVSGAYGKDEKVKVAILLHALGEEALEVYNTLDLAEDKTVGDILAAFRTYCQPKKNTVFERHQFWAHPMAENVTIEKYVTELRQKSKDCEFGASENDMIRDKIVFSMTDRCLKERLLREPNLTLEKAIDTCRAAETSRSQIQAMCAATPERAVHAVHKKTEKDSQTRNKRRKWPAQHTKDAGQVNTCKKMWKITPAEAMSGIRTSVER